MAFPEAGTPQNRTYRTGVKCSFSTGAVRNARRINGICRMAFPEAGTPENRTYRTLELIGHSAPVRLGNRTYRDGVSVHSARVRLGMHVAFRRVRRKTEPTGH